MQYPTKKAKFILLSTLFLAGVALVFAAPELGIWILGHKLVDDAMDPYMAMAYLHSTTNGFQILGTILCYLSARHEDKGTVHSSFPPP